MGINLLDSMIINRISAGEVVESPFSIVKELLDNSIDAGSTKISIEIENGGIDLISIKDNGAGIERDDIKKAFLPHATSKIKNLEDLDEILTLGFRGEALASISNVSQTRIVTKTRDGDFAYNLEVDGGVFGEVEPDSIDSGTKIEVKNLFFNTPARRKFLKKPKVEESQITNIVSRYILAHPDINFKYTVDGKLIYQTKGNSLIDAIYCVYGVDTTQNIVFIEKEINGIKLSGYISKIGYSKPNTTHQTLMINSRYVVDETVSKAVYSAFEEYLMPRQFPFYVLNLTMPVADVDVNVTPNKINVKFSNPSKIFDLVYSACRSAIYTMLNPSELPKDTIQKEEDIKDILIKTDLDSLKEIAIEPNDITSSTSTIVLNQETYSPMTIFDLGKESIVSDKKQDETPIETKSLINEDLKEVNSFVDINNISDFKIVGELFNEFIILEKGQDMILLDFHAGHERLNYDKFTKMVNDRDLVIQDLLVPYTQQVSEVEQTYIMQLKEQLFEIGFEVESFGENKIIISSIPMQLKDINLKNFVDDLIHDMKNLKPTLNNEIKHYLMQKACKSSVKSGMRLSEQEIKELLKNLDMEKPVLLCPHGRPIISVVKRSQIEKWFKRIV